jgi:site-specific DNA recombinase
LNEGDKADEKFKDALSKVISVVAKSYDLFESSKTDEKRGLLGFVFSNLQMEGPTLRYTLRKPFEQLAQLTQNPDGVPYGIRTRVASVKGRRPRP